MNTEIRVVPYLFNRATGCRKLSHDCVMEELGVMAGPPLNVGTFRRQQAHLPVKSSAAFLPLIGP
jgi:hypothetical protein